MDLKLSGIVALQGGLEWWLYLPTLSVSATVLPVCPVCILYSLE